MKMTQTTYSGSPKRTSKPTNSPEPNVSSHDPSLSHHPHPNRTGMGTAKAKAEKSTHSQHDYLPDGMG